METRSERKYVQKRNRREEKRYEDDERRKREVEKKGGKGKMLRRIKEVRKWFQECNKEEKMKFELELIRLFQQVRKGKGDQRNGE